MRDLDMINQQQNYCSTMRINLGGQTKAVNTPLWVDACSRLQSRLSSGRVRPLTYQSSAERLAAMLALRAG
jgi:hypothetical protein